MMTLPEFVTPNVLSGVQSEFDWIQPAKNMRNDGL